MKSGATAQFTPIQWPVTMRAAPTSTYTGFVDNDSSGATSATVYDPTIYGAVGMIVGGTITLSSRLGVTAANTSEL